MISFFRKFFQSKIGLPIFLLFLAVVALAFAASDLTGTTFGGVTGSERVAIVGEDRITTSELATTAQSALQNVQREDPTVTITQFLEQGGLDEVLDQLIARYAIGAYAEKYGLRAGTNLVNSEILKAGVFTGLDGEFSQERYEQFLAEARITDTVLRRDFADGLLAQQLLVPAISNPQMPAKAVRQYAALLTERRSGGIALIPSVLYQPEGELSDEAVQNFYSENRNAYVRPERRTLRYAVIGPQTLERDFSASDAEIAARYEANREDYAARETRDVTLFYVPTQEAAEAIVQRIANGTRLEVAAREAGFNTNTIEGRDRQEFASGASSAVAQAVFSASEGSIAEPARADLGWAVARVDDVARVPEQSLAQVRGEVEEAVIAQKRAGALAELTNEIEDAVNSGTSLAQIADEYDLSLEESPPLLADGRVFGSADAQPNAALRPILDTAFLLDESQPQLDELVPGEQYLVYDVTQIAESAAPPLAEIREQVEAGAKLARGSAAARDVARRVLEKVRDGTSLEDAIAAEDNAELPPADDVSIDRRQLAQFRQQGRNPPPALALLFSMAQGTTKLLEAPREQGWILVDLENIETEPPEENAEGLDVARQQLAEALRSEYTDQLTTAMRAEIGVERNEDAIADVRAQLAGES